jgi:transcriptional regulator with XRE-family HTH domain
VHDIAATVRGRRLALGLSQDELATRARVSRDWVNSFEAGKPRVEFILVLRVLRALNLQLDISEAGNTPSILDAYLDEYQRS